MLMVYGHFTNIVLFQCWDPHDRRQIMTSKVSPRTERVNRRLVVPFEGIRCLLFMDRTVFPSFETGYCFNNSDFE